MEKKSKLVLAVLQGSDSDNTIRNLNERGFMVTVLSSTGGFLKKKSTTVMIGVEEDRLEEALDVLQKYAGHRKETVYQSVTMPHGEMSAVPPVPMEVMAGGAAVFIVSLDDIRKKDLRGSCRAGLFCASKGSSSALSGRLLRVKFCPVPVDLLLIAVRLGKDAAAVLLHIEPQLPGPLVAGPEV